MTDHEKEAYERGIKLDIEEDLETEAAKFAELTKEQAEQREDIVKAIGQRCNALMRYDGKDPALVASALLWCGISMYAQGAPDLTKEGMLLILGSTWEEVQAYLDAIRVADERKKAEQP